MAFGTMLLKKKLILFLFGLFHGMGFASVMQNLPFRMSNLTQLLWCFNLGVEIGQMVIVAAVFPVIFALRKTRIYKPVILIGGSLVMIVRFLRRRSALRKSASMRLCGDISENR